jgi:outer membrane protein assembly factor BamB
MGIASPANKDIPLEWSDTKNILWKRALPGRGASSPVVWRDSIYLTAYSGYGIEKTDPYSNMPKLVRHLLCLDRRSGAVRWQVDLPIGKISEHGLSEFGFLHGFASSTPVVDTDGVYVYFGAGGVFAYDHAGHQRWQVLAGKKYEHNWGSASSPILFENLLIVHPDIEHRALYALDKQNGCEVWHVETGTGDSWSTPLIVEAAGRQELVFHHSAADHKDKSGTALIAAVNPRNGEPLWECRTLRDYLCPSPVAKDGFIYWLGYRNAGAVRGGGKGDVTATHVEWTATRGTSVCTPVLHDGHLYWANEENGLAYCLNAKTGAVVYSERLQPPPGRLYASGVLAGDRIYYVSREKGTWVVEAKPSFRQLAHNRIESDNSIFNGTPAICGNRLFLRSDRFLYCIGTK